MSAAGRGGALVLTLAMLAAPLAGCGRDPSAVKASGMIEMDEIDVASMVGGRVDQLYVDEGDGVTAGDTLAILDREEVAAELSAREAESQRAVAQSREVASGPRSQEIRAARARLASAQAQLVLAESELARTRNLFENQVAAPAELDRAKAARDEARAQRDAAREQLRLLEAGSRQEQILAARATSAAARAGYLAARSRMSELVLVAPVSGVVLLRNYEPGELVPAGSPVVTLGNPDSLWMRVYVAAPLLGGIRRGDPAEVRVTGFEKRLFEGRVTEIATQAEFTPRTALTEEERANIVFGVKIALAPSEGRLKAGLPADAVIRTGSAPRAAR